MRLHFLHTLVLLLTLSSAKGQDYNTYGLGNYAGVAGLISNPASVTSAARADFCGVGLDIAFNNSWLGIKRSAIGFPKLPLSWRTLTPGIENNLFKNFTVKGYKAPYAMVLEQRLLLPSFMWQISKKQTIGLICSYRQFVNVSGVSAQLARIFESEFSFLLLQNNPFLIKNLNAIKMSWLEYGFNYSQSFQVNSKSNLRAGLTFKLVQGLESIYFTGRRLEFLFSTIDTTSYIAGDFSYARSQGAGKSLDLSGRFGPQLPHAAAIQPALDFGLAYELKTQHSYKDRMDYLLRFGLSVLDLGRIRFVKKRDYYDLDSKLTQSDVIRYAGAGSAKAVDSLIQADYPANTGSQQFTVLLPAAINLVADYHVRDFCFVNLSAHLGNLQKTHELRVYNSGAVTLSPRFEKNWYGAALPLTFNAISIRRNQFIMQGLSLRAGPLTIGTTDLTTLFRKDLPNIQFFAICKYSVPYKTLKESWAK